MDLFRDEADLLDSGYLFRITDNGGETYDRITVTFCDGVAILCSLGTICAHIERTDVQVDADAVEAGTARDLRWIDLDPDLRRRIVADLNEGFRDWLEAAPAAETRDEARNWQGLWNEYGDDRTPIYRDGHGFRIRDDENEPHNSGQTGEGLFDTFRDAVRYMLPQDYDLSGPEYHSTVDLADETGGPNEPWDRKADPPHPYEVTGIRHDGKTDADNPHWQAIGEARDEDHAREIWAAWAEANPDRAPLYRRTIGHKVERTFRDF